MISNTFFRSFIENPGTVVPWNSGTVDTSEHLSIFLNTSGAVMKVVSMFCYVFFILIWREIAPHMRI